MFKDLNQLLTAGDVILIFQDIFSVIWFLFLIPHIFFESIVMVVNLLFVKDDVIDNDVVACVNVELSVF